MPDLCRMCKAPLPWRPWWQRLLHPGYCKDSRECFDRFRIRMGWTT